MTDDEKLWLILWERDFSGNSTFTLDQQRSIKEQYKKVYIYRNIRAIQPLEFPPVKESKPSLLKKAKKLISKMKVVRVLVRFGLYS